MHTPNSICEILYKLRDSVNSNKLEYALMLSREVYERLLYMISHKEPIDCILDCERKIDDKFKKD